MSPTMLAGAWPTTAHHPMKLWQEPPPEGPPTKTRFELNVYGPAALDAGAVVADLTALGACLFDLDAVGLVDHRVSRTADVARLLIYAVVVGEQPLEPLALAAQPDVLSGVTRVDIDRFPVWG